MKSLTYIILLLFLSIIFCACEKDDICVDGDTPLLVIGFFDIDNPEELKDVPALVVRGDDGTGTERDIIPNTDLSSISIPLRPKIASTEFILSQNLTSNDSTTVNVDNVSFSYETLDVFVSRACGFVANYTNLDATLTIEPDSLNWIKDIEVIDSLIENSNETHVKIFH